MSNFIRSKGVLLISIASLLFGSFALLFVMVNRGNGSEPENSLTLTKEQAQKAGYYFYPIPQPGDPYSSILIELGSGDVILRKGFRDVGEPVEVIRLTHTGFIVVGEHKIDIDTLAAVIERLAIAHEGKTE